MLRQEFKYRAFVSYSHADREWGQWLQTRLEAYRMPRELVGHEAAAGVVPKRLGSIFRDRWDLSAGHSLNEAIEEALGQAQYLIVVCSRAAAGSVYVNAEIRLYRELHGGENILALIVDGEPGDPERECFPPALLEAGRDGKRFEPIAADARDEGDGRELALLKLIGGLIEVPLDELRRREAVAERRRKRVWMATAAGMAVLAVFACAAAIYAWHLQGLAAQRLLAALDNASTLTRLSGDLVRRHNMPVDSAVRILQQAGKSFDQLEDRAGENMELRYRKAQMHLALTENFRALGKHDLADKSARAASRIMSDIIAHSPDDLARRLDHVRSVTARARLAMQRKDLKTAEMLFAEGRRIGREVTAAHPNAADWLNSRAVSHSQFASLHLARRDL